MALRPSTCGSFSLPRGFKLRSPTVALHATHEVADDESDAYTHLSEFLAHFKPTREIRRMPLSKLAQWLDDDLSETQWFVTGDVRPEYFCEDFLHGNPKTKLSTLEEYVSMVQSVFDQEASKAEIVSTDVDPSQFNTITCTWRVSGKVNVLLWSVDFKSFIVYSDFYINATNGLIQRQEDRLDIPLWDIVLSSIFPFLNGFVTAPEAPALIPRIRTISKNKVLPVEAWVARAGIWGYLLPVRSRRLFLNGTGRMGRGRS